MADLRIARGLSLPLDAVTQTFGILARKGAGKTYTASVFAEELIGAGLPVVILDPLGAFWGLRASADGEKPGLPVTILGGEHGDVPLESGAGKVIADLVVEQPGAYILDLSAFESNAAQDRFVTDFAERLYRLKASHRDPLHLIVDEADSFAPQRPGSNQLRMLGAFEAIVRRGRIRGLGVTLITQRPAVLNKNVLTQIECLIVLQITGPQDRRAIDEWVAGNGTKEERDELVASLAGLQTGEAWFWSPAWLRVFTQARVRTRQTFDSSRTPEPGETLEPKRMAPVDLERLKHRMSTAIEKAKAEDPKELRRRIRELERAVEEARAEKPEVRVERVEVPVLNGQVERLEEVVTRLVLVASGIADIGKDIGGIAEAVVSAIGKVRMADSASRAPERRAVAPVPAPAPRSAPAVPTTLVVDDRPLGRAERALLNVLAAFPEGRTKTQVSILSGYSIKSSSFANALGALRSSGLAEGRDPIRITSVGLEVAGDVEPVPTGTALLEHWRRQLGKAERALLDVLVDAYPAELTKEELSDRSGYSLTSSSFANAIGRLRSLQLVDGLRASEDLF